MLRYLIVRIARENFLWGETGRDSRDGLFCGNQAIAFGDHEYAEERSRADASLNIGSPCAQFKHCPPAQMIFWRGKLQPFCHPDQIGQRLCAHFVHNPADES